MIGTLLIKTFGNYIAPDPEWEEREREGTESGQIMSISDIIGQTIAPDAAYLAHKYGATTNGQDSTATATARSLTPPRSTTTTQQSDYSTPPRNEFSSNGASGGMLSPVSEDSISSPDEVTEELKRLVLDACLGTAESLSSSTTVWETKKDFFTICASSRPLNDVKKKKLQKKLKKDPSLLRIRSAQLGNMVPDGFAPLHAAAYAGNIDAIDVLLKFVHDYTERCDGNDEGVKSVVSKYLDLRDAQGRTALHVAAEVGHIQVTEKLRLAMAEANGIAPIGEDAPIDLSRRTPLGWALTSRSQSAKKNREKLEAVLFSPGDRSVNPRRPLSTRCSSTKGRSSMKRSVRPGLDLTFAYSEMPGRRVEMEDAVCYHNPVSTIDGIALFGVFDGHGNGLVSKFVAANLLNCFLKQNEASSRASVEDLKKGLIKACLDVDQLLKAEPENFGKSGGSTGIVALITPSHVIVANIGDSRAILVQQAACADLRESDEAITIAIQDPKPCPIAVAMSQDHTPNLPAERQRIEAAGHEVESITYKPQEGGEDKTIYKVKGKGTLAKNKLGMSRAFGDFDYKTNKELPHESQAVIAVPEVKILERSSKDEFIVLACDGVWDVMTNEECAAFVSKECNRDSEPEDLAKMCDDLLRDCFDRGSTDNMSVLVVSLLAPLGTGQTLDFGE